MGIFDRLKGKGKAEAGDEASVGAGANAATALPSASEALAWCARRCGEDLDGRPYVREDAGDGEFAPGWDYLNWAFGGLYPDQPDPKQFAPKVPASLGGPDPLDGISIYDAGEFYHFVTYGFSDLYGQNLGDGESGFGMELTFKLAKEGLGDTYAELLNVAGLMQSLARLTFQRGMVFLPYQTIYTGQQRGIDAEGRSLIRGFITVPGEDVASIETPSGRVVITHLVGATNEELLAIRELDDKVARLYEAIGTDVTRLDRASLL